MKHIQGVDEADRDPVHILRHPHGECTPSRPEGIRGNYSDRLTFHMRNRTVVCVLALDMPENEKIGPRYEADEIKNNEFNRKNTATVCLMTHKRN